MNRERRKSWLDALGLSFSPPSDPRDETQLGLQQAEERLAPTSLFGMEAPTDVGIPPIPDNLLGDTAYVSTQDIAAAPRAEGHQISLSEHDSNARQKLPLPPHKSSS